MRKSNNNTLISRSRQVQSFQWKSSQPTKNSVQKCLCVAIRGNFKSVIVAAILVFLCWRADLSEVSSLEISSVIVRTMPLPFYHLSASSYTPFHAFSYPLRATTEILETRKKKKYNSILSPSPTPSILLLLLFILLGNLLYFNFSR